MKEKIKDWNPQKKTIVLLEKINNILVKFKENDIKVTVRQLFYQLVSENIISNNLNSYMKISSLVSQGRYAGIIDWDIIEDNSSFVKLPYFFDDVDDLINTAVQSFKLDRWKGQDFYVEVW